MLKSAYALPQPNQAKPMLRTLVLLLLVCNLAYFAWSQGWLRFYGLAPAQQSEPQRLQQQIRPEALQLHGPLATPASPEASTATPKSEPKPAP